MADQSQNIELIDGLLDEFKEHRNEIKKMISEIESIREQVSGLFPEKLDKRYLNMFEERVKAVTNLFSTLLDMRKEITKSIKDEIELRRRMLKDDIGSDESLEDLFDIRKIAKKVEKFSKETEKLKSIGGEEWKKSQKESKELEPSTSQTAVG